MIRILGEILDRLFCTVLACLFSQVPAYIAQYQTVLDQNWQALQTEVIQIDEQAEDNLQSRKDFIDQLLTHPDSSLREAGKARIEVIKAYQKVSAMRDALIGAPAWKKPFVLYQTWDKKYAQVLSYTPTLPLNLVGFFYAFIGLLLGYGLTSLFRLLFVRKRNTSGISKSVNTYQ